MGALFLGFIKLSSLMTEASKDIKRPRRLGRGLFLVDLLFGGGGEEAFFLEGADGLGADFHSHFFAINHQGFGLEIGLPDFLGVALRKTDIAAVLFAFAGEFTFLHNVSLHSL